MRVKPALRPVFKPLDCNNDLLSLLVQVLEGVANDKLIELDPLLDVLEAMIAPYKLSTEKQEWQKLALSDCFYSQCFRSIDFISAIQYKYQMED